MPVFGFMQESVIPRDVQMNEAFAFGQRREKESLTAPLQGGVAVLGDAGPPNAHAHHQGVDEEQTTSNPMSESIPSKM